MNKIFCFLTGGHRYADINLKVRYDQVHRGYHISNNCVKCNHYYSFFCPDEVLERDMFTKY